jgi:hypothetical protein
MVGYGIILSMVCITLGAIVYFNVKRVKWRIFWIAGAPLLVTVLFYFYVAIVSSAPVDEFLTWSILIVGLGTGLGAIMTGLGVLGGYLFSRISR